MRHSETNTRSQSLQTLHQNASANASAEYALLLGVLAIALLIGVAAIGRGTNGVFANVATGVTSQVSEVSTFGPSAESSQFHPLYDSRR